MDEFLILVVDQDRKKVDGFYILNSPPPSSRIQMRKRKENVEKLLPTNPHPSMPVSSIKIDTQVYPS